MRTKKKRFARQLQSALRVAWSRKGRRKAIPCLQEGTIGEDLVVKPLPASLRPLLPPNNERLRDEEEEISENVLLENDDEVFMNEEEGEELVFSDGLPLVADDESEARKALLG